jgi:hypothetical protein
MHLANGLRAVFQLCCYRYGVTDAETTGKNPYDSVRLDIAPLFPLSSALGDTELLQAKLDLLRHFGFPLGTANTTVSSSSSGDTGSDISEQECSAEQHSTTSRYR